MGNETRRNNLVVAIVALGASITSLRNGFAYDDIPIIAENPRLHLGTWWSLFGSSYWPPQYGESLYRPVSMLAFAIERAAGGGNPMIFHATSIALFMLLAVLVTILLRQFLDERSSLVGGALFAAHPVHTEPIANVVGQSELLAAIGVVGATIIYVRARSSGGPSFRQSLAMAALYAGASLAKEHALFLPLLIGAAELILHRRPTDRRPAARTLVMLLLVGAGALAARTAVLGSLFGEQNPVEMNVSTRIWMLFRVVPEWVRLLVWPAHLSAEYGPRQIEIIDGPTTLGVTGVVLVVAIIVMLMRSSGRQVGFALGLAWLAITFIPVSNLISGVVLQERTLMLPSVGAMLAFGAGFQLARVRAADATTRYALAALAAMLVVAGTWRSAARNPIWADNATLFAQMVQDAPRSYRAHYLYGSEQFGEGRNADGERELRLALALSRNDSDPYNFLATKYREAGLFAQAIPLYRQALAIRPKRPDSRFGLALSLLETGDATGALAQADTGLATGQLKGYFDWVRARADSAVHAHRRG